MSTAAQQIDFLKEVPLFAHLDDEQLLTLAHDFQLKVYDKHETVFRQGDPNTEFYVVLEGKVRIFKISPAGDETSIQIFSQHDIIGEFAAIDEQPRSANGKAIGPCRLLMMHGELFLHHLHAIPGLALNLARLLTNKLRWTAAYAESVARYDASGRLLHILLQYNEQFGHEIEADRVYQLDLGLKHADLASLVGVRREWISKLLKSWKARGLLAYKSGQITILDLPRVEAERDSRIEEKHGEW